MNSVILLGRLGRDPETRTFENGSITSFSLATSEVFKDKNGDKKEKTEWHNVSFWGKQGEVIAKFFKKGDPILVTGKITYREYEKDGVKRYACDIIGQGFEFTPKSSGSSQNSSVIIEVEDGVYDDDLPF